ncbi:MAG: hypothetical protein M1835_000484 [Candelina submexicana]|nr:MAG: hypothetical protein M1835_000484 [Candelina submexicana]
MPILALPQTTVRAIGSSQVLTDPCSVVKELIDNAIDAQASSIFVEISTNTLDIIQVKDNGHGIAPEDREMVCRRYCTSKLREYSDLRGIGARWLGFRGEALASAAEMAGSMTVLTRVEGEDVATSLKVGRTGEVQSQERASHPVGTTIKVSDFFKNLPVRRQTALKSSTKTLSKIKQTLQAYALARPAVRLSLRVLKAKNDKGNWTYAPNKAARFADAALKVAGKDTAGQCSHLIHSSDDYGSVNSREDDGEGATEEERQEGGFRIEAFLPRLGADPSKINGQGHYISIDSRPVSCTRGLLKQVLVLYKDYIRSALSTLSASRLVNPFICMNVSCPPGSYDANVEPAKDDVLFEDPDHVLSLMRSFFKSIYGELVVMEDDATKVPKSIGNVAAKPFDLLLAKKRPTADAVEKPSAVDMAPTMSKLGPELDRDTTSVTGPEPVEDATQVSGDTPLSPMSESHLCETSPIDKDRPAKRRRTWRFNMYGGDEEDMDDPIEGKDQDQRSTTEEGPEALRDLGVNNPWIIAKMNAPIRSRQLERRKVVEGDGEPRNMQLMTPARDQGSLERNSTPFPSLKHPTDGLGRQALPTPERSHPPSSPLKGLPSSPFQRTVHTPVRQQDHSETLDSIIYAPPSVRLQHPNRSTDGLNEYSSLDASRRERLRAPVNDFISARDLPLGTPLDLIPTAPVQPPRKRESRKQLQHDNAINKPFVSPVHDPDRVWFPTDIPARRSKPSTKPRAGTVRGAVNLLAPVRPDSEDEEPPKSHAAQTRAPTRKPDLDEMLEYEHRKQAATKRRRSQLLLTSSGTLEKPAELEDNEACLPAITTSSPHRNRYNAARAALKRPTPQPFVNATNLPITESNSEAPRPLVFPEGDPRAYLMRVRRRSANHQATDGKKASHGVKVKRTKTMLLPLESTPIEARTKGLSLVLKQGMEDVEKEVRKARDVEAYVRGGPACGAFDELDEEEVGMLEKRLKSLLEEGGWRLDDGMAELDVDLKTAFEQHHAAAAAMSGEEG